MDVRALVSVLVRKLPYLTVFVGVVAAGVFFLLGRIAPVYTSEATILIEMGESDLTRTNESSGRTDTVLDEQAITSQVQLIRSRDLAQRVSEKLDLAKRGEFDPELAERSAFQDVLSRLGLAEVTTDSSIEERVLKAYYKKLSVYAVERSRVITVEFSSNDPELAASAANAIAEGYIALQREAKRDTTAVAVEWLSTQIADLRTKVVDAEAKVERFRTEHDLFSSGGQTPTTLTEQQLGDLSGELARVHGERVDAETKAAQIRAGIEAGAAPNLTDVINSQLIQRLVEQEVALRSQIAQLSATLLSEHPRMKELNAQVADLDRQIAAEARKILESFEAEAALARSREADIARNLDELKSVAARANDAAVDLRALDREASAQRELLDSYLRRYREALAREQANYLPVDARVISRAAVSIEPSFPKKVPMTAATAAATLILAVAFVLLNELASGRPMRRAPLGVPASPVTETAPGRGRLGWPDDLGRTAPEEATLVPAIDHQVDESLAAIASEVADRGVKRVLVTVAEAGDREKRPLAAVALARALARSEARVVVIDFHDDDADTIAMGEAADLPGFSDLFDGEASFAQVIFRDRRSRVHFIPAGSKPLRAELLEAERLETVLSALTLTYDHVIVDASDEMIALLAPECGLALVASAFGADDRQTKAAFDRITAASDAEVRLLVAESAGDEAEFSAALGQGGKKQPADAAA
ncbi:MAG: exopolysaccharide transport family protein [Bauldia sp.]